MAASARYLASAAAAGEDISYAASLCSTVNRDGDGDGDGVGDGAVVRGNIRNLVTVQMAKRWK